MLLNSEHRWRSSSETSSMRKTCTTPDLQLREEEGPLQSVLSLLSQTGLECLEKSCTIHPILHQVLLPSISSHSTKCRSITSLCISRSTKPARGTHSTSQPSLSISHLSRHVSIHRVSNTRLPETSILSNNRISISQCSTTHCPRCLIIPGPQITLHRATCHLPQCHTSRSIRIHLGFTCMSRVRLSIPCSIPNTKSQRTSGRSNVAHLQPLMLAS